MAQLSPSTYVELHQSTNRTFDPYMPVVVVGAIVGGVVLAVASGIHTTFWTTQRVRRGVLCDRDRDHRSHELADQQTGCPLVN